MTRIHHVFPRAAAMAALVASASGAQSLADRVSSAAPGAVQFTFAARPGVCGNGRTFIQTGNSTYHGSFTTINGEVIRAEPCQNGPVRVVIDRAGRDIIGIQSYVGLPQAPVAITDLGRVSGQQAADFLLEVAARAEGRVGRDAIFPATLADSATSTDRLIAIARNQALSRDTRRAAMSYMNNSVPVGAVLPQRAADAMVAIAKDETDNQQVRQSALSLLSRLEHGVGIPALVELSRMAGHTWLAKESIAALSRSGDPRAREFLRTTAQRNDLPDDVMATVIQSLGREYSTAQDAALLRRIYPTLRGDRARSAVISALAEVGGSENIRWLMDVARSDSTPDSRRRTALDAAVRGGVPTVELVRLYDATGDQRLKETVLSALVRVGDEAAVEKLVSILRTETNYTIRRSAASKLANSEDPRIRQAMRDIIIR